MASGVIPFAHDQMSGRFDETVHNPIPNGYRDIRNDPDELFDKDISVIPVGQVCGALREVVPAKHVVEEITEQLIAVMSSFRVNPR